MTLLSQKRLNREEAARFLGVSGKTISNWRDAGLMPLPMKLGASEFWLKPQLEKWVAEQNPHLIETESQEQAAK